MPSSTAYFAVDETPIHVISEASEIMLVNVNAEDGDPAGVTFVKFYESLTTPTISSATPVLSVMCVRGQSITVPVFLESASLWMAATSVDGVDATAPTDPVTVNLITRRL